MVALRGRNLEDPNRHFPCSMKPVVFMVPRAAGSLFKNYDVFDALREKPKMAGAVLAPTAQPICWLKPAGVVSSDGTARGPMLGLLLALMMAASHALDNGLALSGPAMGWCEMQLGQNLGSW